MSEIAWKIQSWSHIKVQNSISKCLLHDNAVEWRDFLVYVGHLFVVEARTTDPQLPTWLAMI